MNERIKQLADEAENYAREQNDLHGVSYIQTFKAKFAELIVRECMEQVKDFYQEDRFNCYNAAEAIKEHFGVE